MSRAAKTKILNSSHCGRKIRIYLQYSRWINVKGLKLGLLCRSWQCWCQWIYCFWDMKSII